MKCFSLTQYRPSPAPTGHPIHEEGWLLAAFGRIFENARSAYLHC